MNRLHFTLPSDEPAYREWLAAKYGPELVARHDKLQAQADDDYLTRLARPESGPVTDAEREAVDRLIGLQEGETFEQRVEREREALKRHPPHRMPEGFCDPQAADVYNGVAPCGACGKTGIAENSGPIARAQSNESGLRAPTRGRTSPPLGGCEPEDWARLSDPESWRPSWQGTGDIARRHDDLDGRKAVAVVGAFLLGVTIGLLLSPIATRLFA